MRVGSKFVPCNFRSICRREAGGAHSKCGRRLHDTFLQGLFAASLQLRVAVDSLEEDSTAKERFKKSLQAMDRVVEDGRRAVQGLRSIQHRFPSLGHALAGVPNDLGLPSAKGFRVVVEGRQQEIGADMLDDIYYIGREAIINAHRHSGGSDVAVEIKYRRKQVRVAVRDNGCGINPQLLRRDGHWGLQGMRERAERIGARLRILSKAALGTEVELCVPTGNLLKQRGFQPAC